MKKKCMIHVFVMMICLLVALDAHAHRVTVFAWVDGDTVHTQSKFGGGKMVNQGEIRVYDPEGNLLLKGNTDENGEYSFKVPGKTSLKIELNAGMGHQSEWIIPAEDLGGLPQGDFPTVSDPLKDSKGVVEAKNDLSITAGLTKEDLEQAVEQAVEKKLKPVMQMLSDLSDPGPRISDILGGIGYIIGLVGIGAYVISRKKKDSEIR